MSLLKAENIKKNFGGVQALVNGELTIEEGKILGLLGANGSGKSTISKILCGIHTPCEGAIYYDGQHVTINSPEKARSYGIVMIHQHLSLIPELSVWENIVMGREKVNKFGFISDQENKKLARESLRKLTDTIGLDEKVGRLSPSEKQIVEIAKALSQNPSILILDEPTASLEQSQVNRLFDILIKLKKTGVAMVFISHRMWEVIKICDAISVYRNGETVGHVDLQQGAFKEEAIIAMITGKEEAKSTSDKIMTLGNEAKERIVVEGLQMPGALKNIHLSVKQGEIVGIAGLSGQGQEELLLALSGFMKAKKTTLRMDGVVKKANSPKQAIEAGIVLVPGDRHEEGLFLEHSINDNLTYPFIASKQIKGLIQFKVCKAQIEKAIEQMNIIPKDGTKLLKQLSGGNQQKVVVGKWLSLKPKVLLLSDPAKGVDVNAKEEMYQVIRKIAQEGTSVVLYASDNEELIHICHRVLVMFEGEIIVELSGNNLRDEMIVEASLGYDCTKLKSRGEAV